MFLWVVALFSIFITTDAAFAQGDLLQKTRIVNFLGERYGVFYQWSHIDGNLPMEQLHEAQLEISEKILNTEGRIKSGNYSYYNTVEGATSKLSGSMVAEGKPLYLNELFVAERELDYATNKFPGARAGQTFTHYVQSELDDARGLRKVHQFTGSGLTDLELQELNSKAQRTLNMKDQSWGSMSNAVRKVLNTRIERILSLRAYTMTNAAMLADGIVRNVTQYPGERVGKYTAAFDEAWEGKQMDPDAKASPIKKTTTLKPGQGGWFKGGLGTSGNMLNFAGFALAIMAPELNPFAEVKGLDCEDAKAKLNRLICKWESKFSASNNNVQCTVARDVFENSSESCGASFDVMMFTIDDHDSKERFKESKMLNSSGILIKDDPIESIAANLQKFYKILNLKIGKDFKTDSNRI